MILSKPVKVAASSVLLWAGVEISYFLWFSLKKFFDTSGVDPLNTVMFFSNRSTECFVNGHNADKCERTNCADQNMRLIRNTVETAKASIDVCMFRLSNTFLSTILEKAINNGVKVRVFHDQNFESEPVAIIQLQQRGAFVRCKEYQTDKYREKFLMHHKFLVIDNKFVITGSLNWTKSAVSGNWEDAAIMSEPSFVKKFNDEFQYLWDNYKTPVDLLPPPATSLAFPSNMSVWKENPFNEVFMFREDTASCRTHMSRLKFDRQDPHHTPVCAFNTLLKLGELLRTAEKSIDICLLLLNLENVADVFLDAFFRGLKVRVVSDMHMANVSGSQIRDLINEGVEVRGRQSHSQMHHKFIILDKKLVLFGSFNWSMQALCGNSENLVCTNNHNIVKKFSEQFDELWNDFEPIEVEKIGLRNFRGT